MLNQLEQRPAATDIDDDDGLFHLCCDYTDDWGLCGTDLSEVPFSDGVGEARCETCDEFDEADFCAHCAMNAGAA